VHAVDQPGERSGSVATGLRSLVGESVLVIEQHIDLAHGRQPYSVYGATGRRLGGVRPGASGDCSLELVDSEGALVLALALPARKDIVAVRDAEGKEAGRIMKQHLPGATTFVLEGPRGAHVGYVRGRSWVGWDIRIENERNREVGRINRDWTGLQRADFPTPDNYVVRMAQPQLEPLRTLAVAAGLVAASALRKDARVHLAR
jgi:hypothetical protein